jgi:hypothetical protein
MKTELAKMHLHCGKRHRHCERSEAIQRRAKCAK